VLSPNRSKTCVTDTSSKSSRSTLAESMQRHPTRTSSTQLRIEHQLHRHIQHQQSTTHKQRRQSSSRETADCSSPSEASKNRPAPKSCIWSWGVPPGPALHCRCAACFYLDSRICLNPFYCIGRRFLQDSSPSGMQVCGLLYGIHLCGTQN
jgi:hypothetical protein